MPASLDLDGLQRALSAFSASQGTGTIVATGTNQATAAPASKLLTIITASVAGAGVTIAPIFGQLQIVYNDTTNAVSVYPLLNMTLKPAASLAVIPGGSIGVIAIDASRAYIAFESTSFG